MISLHGNRALYLHLWISVCDLIGCVGVAMVTLDIEFDNATGDYWPVLYINDYWNLARDYQPLNDTTK